MSLTPPLEVYLLGLAEFDDVQRLQRRLSYDLGEDGRGGAMVLCEHPPVISVGRSGSRAHIRADDDQLQGAGIPTRWVNRGGGCVLHLPGQLCVYLMLPLRRLGLDVRGYLDGLHEAIVRVLQEFDLPGSRKSDAPGVFVGNGRVATVGVSVVRWITGHGMTLNVGPYLRAFDLLDEPGPDAYALRQTSIEARRQRPAPMPKVREAVIRAVAGTFGFSRQHLYTEHPLIGRKTYPHDYVRASG